MVDFFDSEINKGQNEYDDNLNDNGGIHDDSGSEIGMNDVNSYNYEDPNGNPPDDTDSNIAHNDNANGTGGPGNGVGANDFLAYKNKPKLLLFLILICALLGALVGSLVTYIVGVQKTVIVKQFSPNISTISQPTQQQVQQILKKILPAVVSISVNQGNGNSDQGTGVVITSGGEVITNNHVIANASSISVTFSTSNITKKAVLVNTDPTDDVALLQIQNVSGLPTVNFSQSNNIQVGEWVLAIGNALALQGGPTVTEGIISAVGRTVPAGDASTGFTETLTNMIQTDAAINPGNSGGPLVDFNGNVVGINTAAASSASNNAPAQNIGFAIPASKILSLIPVLRTSSVTNGTHGYLGVTVGDLTGVARSYYGIGPFPLSGAVVESVTANSPAQQVGIQPGDVIVGINSTKVTSAQSLVNLLDTLSPGTSITLYLYSGGFEYNVPVTLGSSASASATSG